MHLVNEMLALLPSNGVSTTTVSSPSSITSPTMSCLPAGQISAFPFTGIPGNSIGCMQTCATGLNGPNGVTVNTLNGVQAPYNGFSVNGIPTNYTIAPNGVAINGINGINGINISPVTTCASTACSVSTSYNGLTINGVPYVPPTALTSPEVYGLPPPSMTTTTKSTTSADSSSSGETSPAPLSPAASMELVWHGEFDRLFSQYFPHIWCLVPTFCPPSESWRTFKDSAKVRFSCQDCGHGWTSMKGRVVFWFELNFGTNSGCVMFKLYGQQCQRCKTGKFEHAMWYPEEVVKVIGNVYNRVGQIYYGFVRPPLRIDRRVGKPRNQHNAELCQACKEGLCKEEWSFA